MNPKRIVISGGPGTGKTSVIKTLEQQGYFCFHEIIREMTLEAKKHGNEDTFVSNPLLFVDDPMLFNQKILEGRLKQFTNAETLGRDIVFYDRGLLDVLAYMDYFGQEYGDNFTKPCTTNIYDTVFLLPPWEEIYISDNERMESYEEAVQLHERLEATYARFGYDVIIVPKTTVDQRIAFIKTHLKLSS